MAVTAYLEAAGCCVPRLLAHFALLTLNRLLSEAWDGAEMLQHVIAYGECGR